MNCPITGKSYTGKKLRIAEMLRDRFQAQSPRITSEGHGQWFNVTIGTPAFPRHNREAEAAIKELLKDDGKFMGCDVWSEPESNDRMQDMAFALAARRTDLSLAEACRLVLNKAKAGSLDVADLKVIEAALDRPDSLLANHNLALVALEETAINGPPANLEKLVADLQRQNIVTVNCPICPHCGSDDVGIDEHRCEVEQGDVVYQDWRCFAADCNRRVATVEYRPVKFWRIDDDDNMGPTVYLKPGDNNLG